MKTITLKDIADALSISPSLVSRALNDKYGVGEELRTQIKRKAAEMGYISRLHQPEPPKTAKVFVSFSEELSEIFRKTGLYGQIVEGVSERLAEENMQTELIFQLPIPEKNAEFLSAMSPAGVIAVGPISPEHLTAIRAIGVPVVLIDPYRYDENDIDLVRANNFAVGTRAAKIAIERGFSNIAFVGNPDYAVSFRNRYEGFCAVLGENGIKHTLITDHNPDHPVCKPEELRRFLLCANYPLFAFCGNDYTANALHKIAKALYIDVPGRLSIVGCDTVTYLNAPTFASFDLQPAQMGIAAADLLLRRMMHFDAPCYYLQIEPKFVCGETLGYSNARTF